MHHHVSRQPSGTHAPAPHRHRARRFARLGALILGMALGTSGCGGGVYLDLGWTDWGDAPPSVVLAASPTAALPGSAVRLQADANDDYRVVRVRFYRFDDSGTALWLGDDYAWPYRWDTLQPDSGRSSVRYVARAEDDSGQYRDSATLDVTVLR